MDVHSDPSSQRLLLLASRVRRSILLLVVGGVPLLFLHRVTWDAYNLPKMALLFAGVAVVTVVRAVELLYGRRLTGLGSLSIPALALGIPLLLAWVFSPYQGWALFGEYGRYQGLLPSLTLILFGVLLADTFRGRTHQVGWALLVAGGLAGLYSLLQAVGLDPFVYDELNRDPLTGLYYAQSTLGNSNFAGGFFAIVIPVGISLIMSDPINRNRAVFLTIAAALGCLTSFSQGGWGAAVGGIAVTGGLLLASRKSIARWIGIALALLIGILMVATVVVAGLRGPPDVGWSTSLSRAWKWEAATSMAAARPFIGWGPNVFAVEGIRFRSREAAIRQPDVLATDLHSVPLGYVTSAGVLGALGFATFLGWAALLGWRKAKSSALAAGFLGGFTAYILQGLVGVDEPSIRLAMWVCIAGLVGVSLRAAELRRPQVALVRRTGIVLAGLLSIAVVMWSLMWVNSDRHVRIGNTLALDNRPEPAKAAFLKGLSTRDDYEVRRIYGTRIGELGTRRGIQGAPYINDMRKAFRYLDNFPQITGLIAEARLLHAWAEKADPTADPEALQLYRRARQLDPWNPVWAVEEADVFLALDRPEEALEVLAPFRASNLPYSIYWGSLALTYAHLGDSSSARSAIAIALSIEPDDFRANAAKVLLESEKG